MTPLDIREVGFPERPCQLIICADGMLEETADERLLQSRNIFIANVGIQEVLYCLGKGSDGLLCRILADIWCLEFYRAFYDILLNASVKGQVILWYISVEEAHISHEAHSYLVRIFAIVRLE